MAWNGSGTFSRTNGTNTGAETWQDDQAAGTKILSSRHDTHDEDIATAINACLTKNNETKPTANFIPNVDSSYDLGSASVRWRVGYFDTITVDDITAANLQSVVQQVYNIDSAVATGTTAMVADDTIPQNTEGDQYLSQAITPLDTSNILRIDVTIYISSSQGSNELAAALFQDSTAGALASAINYESGSSRLEPITFTHLMAAGTVSETTFKVRAGGSTGATTSFNGVAGTRRHGGVLSSSIIITEYKP